MTQMVSQPDNSYSGQIPPELNMGPGSLSAKDAQKLVTFVNKKYQEMKAGRTQFERQWYLNLSFYFGKQNVVYRNVAGAGGKLLVPPAPPWRVRMVVNKIRPIVRRTQAKLTAQKPSATIVPASSDDADLFAANAGEQIWESMYSKNELKQVLKRAVWWQLVCGNGFIKTYWDQSKTVPAGLDVPPYQGDICFTPETPFHLFVPDLRAEDIEEQPYMIHSSTRTPEWLKSRYSHTLDGQEVKPNVKGSNELLDDAFLNLVGGTAYDNDSVLVHEMHIKPGVFPDYPEGAVITITGDQVIQMVPFFPYDHGQYCVTKFDHIPSGKFYATSVIEDLIPIQREYNRTRSQIVEAKNRMAKPQLTAQEGAVSVAKMTSEPGQVIEYKVGFQPPQPLPLQPLPNYVLQEVQQLTADFDDISGQHEVTRGNVPPGVTAATAISYLQEQDDSMLAHEVDSIESGMEKIAKQTLSLVGQYWDTPRVVKITGVDGSWDAAMFKGADLRGNTDIRIEAGSALPTSKAAKQALITDWMKMGFIPPEEGMAVLDMGGLVKLYERVQIDQAQARRENLKMQNCPPELIEQMFAPPTDPMGNPLPPEEYMIDPMSGKPRLPDPVVPVNTWDNHAIHIDIHNRFRKSQAYESLDPMRQMLFEVHVQKHMEAIAAPHIGGQPTAEMMIGIAEQQRNQPPPTDVNTPDAMDTMQNPGAMEEMEAQQSGPEAMPETESGE